MAPASKRVPASFYRTDSGNEPVREWLRSLEPENRKAIGDDIQTLEFGWPVGMPVCRPMSGHRGLWEVRSGLPGGRIARVLFCIAAGRIVLLHGFVKKAQKTPKPDIDTALKRMKELAQ
jgi:phage-related protein